MNNTTEQQDDVVRISNDGTAEKADDDFKLAYCYIVKNYYEQGKSITTKNVFKVQEQLKKLGIEQESFKAFRDGVQLKACLSDTADELPTVDEAEDFASGCFHNFIYSFDNKIIPRTLWETPIMCWRAFISYIMLLTPKNGALILPQIKHPQSVIIPLAKAYRKLPELQYSAPVKTEIGTKGGMTRTAFLRIDNASGAPMTGTNSANIDFADTVIVAVFGQMYEANRNADGAAILTPASIYKEITRTDAKPSQGEIDYLVQRVERLRATKNIIQIKECSRGESAEDGEIIFEADDYVLSMTRQTAKHSNGNDAGFVYILDKAPTFYLYSIEEAKQYATVRKELISGKNGRKKRLLNGLDGALLSRFLLERIRLILGQKRQHKNNKAFIALDEITTALCGAEPPTDRQRRSIITAATEKLDEFTKMDEISGFSERRGERNKMLGYDIEYSKKQLKGN